MIKNYLKIAWRNISRNRFYSTLNILGLSVGISFCMLIGAYVWDALQVNSKLKNSERQFIIQSRWGNSPGFDLTTVGNLAKELRNQYPNLVANYYRWDGITSNVSKGNKHFRENIQINDSTFFSMYDFPVLSGNPTAAFNDPFSAVITENIANRYFPADATHSKAGVVGQTLTIENFSGTKHDFVITAVLKDAPTNSVTKINDDNYNDIFLSPLAANFFERQIDSWNNPWIVGYIELQKGVSPRQLDQPMRSLVSKNTPFGISDQMHPLLVSLNQYYLKASNGLVEKMLYTLSFIAIFILLMAVVNFINISISRSSSRMKEIGVRKVLGGMKNQLVQQFLAESVLLSVIATLFALVIYYFVRPSLSDILGKEIPLLSSLPVYLFAIPVVLAIVIGLLAGIYPALVLASLKSAEVIKGKLASIKENIFLRKSLVTFQFSIAVVVLIGSLVISKQISHFFSKDLGYDKEFVLSAQLPRDWSRQGVDHMEIVRDDLATLPRISNVTLSYEVPNGNNGGNALAFQASEDSTKSFSHLILSTDENYASAYRIPLVAGSFFKPAERFDSSKIVINETSANVLGWKDPSEAINKQIKMQGYNNIVFTVVGVVKDFHFDSMQKPIEPLVFTNVRFSQTYRFLSFRIQPGDVAKSIASIQQKWSSLMPDAPFAFRFMDDSLKKIYTNELQLKKAGYAATILSLIVVLLGVLGLVSLSIQKRTKEIGIRKVLGASVGGVLSLFLKEFIVLVIISAFIACPVAYYIMHSWLADYAYRIPLKAQPFILSISLLGVLTVLLICLQTLKTANSNPIKSLRTE